MILTFLLLLVPAHILFNPSIRKYMYYHKWPEWATSYGIVIFYLNYVIFLCLYLIITH